MMKKGGGATVCGSSDEGKSEREKILSEIVQSLASSRENESWGLMVEASEDYQRLVLTYLDYLYGFTEIISLQ